MCFNDEFLHNLIAFPMIMTIFVQQVEYAVIGICLVKFMLKYVNLEGGNLCCDSNQEIGVGV